MDGVHGRTSYTWYCFTPIQRGLGIEFHIPDAHVIRTPSRSGRRSRFRRSHMPNLVWPISAVEHPDGRPYPWLSEPVDRWPQSQFLIYREMSDQELCVRLSRLEAAVAIARTLRRTLVLPTWLYPSADAHMDIHRLAQLVPIASIEECRAALRLARRQPGESVAMCSVHAARTGSPWRELSSAFSRPGICTPHTASPVTGTPDHERAPDLELPLEIDLELPLEIDSPLRGAAELRQRWGLRHCVLVIDDVLGAVAPASLLDAGERALFLQCLRPCRRLTGRLRTFLDRGVDRPFLAVRADLADARAVAAEVARTSAAGGSATTASPVRVRHRAWVYASAQPAPPPPPLATLPLLASCEQALEGEEGIGAEVLRLWICACADWFVGASGSLDSEWVRRLRLSGGGKVLLHVLVDGVSEQDGAPAARRQGDEARRTSDAADLRVLPAVCASPSRMRHGLCCGRHRTTAAGFRYARPRPPQASVHTQRPHQQAGLVHSGSPAAHHPVSVPPEAVPVPPPTGCQLASRPAQPAQPAQPSRPWLPPDNLSGVQLYDHFILDRLPLLRRRRLRPAAGGSTASVALIVEPRCHNALEHVVRNAFHFLGAEWQRERPAYP